MDQPFLPPGDTAAVASSPDWIAILKEENKLAPTKTSPADPKADSDITLYSGPFWSNVSNITEWNHFFSSDANVAFFGKDTIPSSIPNRPNNAWVGDRGGSAVLLLKSPASTVVSLTDVMHAFRVAGDKASPIRKLLDKLLAALHMTLQTTPASAGRDIIPGFWFATTPSGYFSRSTLVYKATIANKTIMDWFEDSFEDLIPKSLKDDCTLAFTEYSIYSVNQTVSITRLTVASVRLGIGDCWLDLDLSERMAKLIIRPKIAGLSVLAILHNVFGTSNFDETNFKDGGSEDKNVCSKFFNGITVSYVHITRDVSSASKKWSWGVGMVASWKSKSTVTVAFGLKYESASGTFFGSLLLQADAQKASQKKDIFYEPRLQLDVPDGVPAKLNLLTLFDADIDIADAPILVYVAEASMILVKKPVQVSLHAKFVGSDFSASCPFPFTWDEATIDIVKADELELRITASFTLHAKRDGAAIALLDGGLYYRSGPERQWIIRAAVHNLSVGSLRGFFAEGDAQDGVNVMEKLTLKSLEMMYACHKGSASSFIITGVLVFGELEFDLVFRHDSKDGSPSAADLYEKEKNVQLKKPSGTSSWSFTASMTPTSPSSTIGRVLTSIMPGSEHEILGKIPEFIRGILVDPKAGKTPSAEISYQSSGGCSVFGVWLSIAEINFTFLQFKTADKNIKRAVRISVDQIPLMDKIPIVGKMPQPFDHLEYVWVEHDSGKPGGITWGDMEAIVPLYPKDIPPFQFKKKAKPPVTADVILATGHHFIVIVKGEVVLDHVFQTNANDSKGVVAPPQTSPSLLSRGAANFVNEDTTIETASDNGKGNGKDLMEAPPSKGNARPKADPFSISALSLQYKHGTLVVSIDATLTLGPLTLSVIGFTLEIQLAKVKLHDLKKIVHEGLIAAALHGLEVSLEQGPLTLKGVFIHDRSEESGTLSSESYRGGITVGFKVWQVLAIGEYKITYENKKEKFRSVFVYGKLDGPLIELEFATISGVRLGFGYNYSIRMPRLDELPTFPLITDSGVGGASNDPMNVLTKFIGSGKKTDAFVWANPGSGWFAAGMSITAFDVLTLTAVIVVDIETGATNPSEKGCILALFAHGVFQMEPLTQPDWSLFYIELLVKVELNFIHGYICAEAALAPASHLYVPFAHLVGSASFYTWFGNNEHAGDWVVSLGGYARSYAVREWYPKPSRIGVAFTVGDEIHVVGEAYAAVTPQCAMGGGALHLSLDVGPVSAYADLMFDAYINFKPFHFRAELSISVGVECDVDILFVHVHVSLHLGADVVLWGPHDFGGRAHVDFWFYGFDISFGADENADAKQAISLENFYEAVIKPGPATKEPTKDEVGAVGAPAALHKYTVENGMAPVKTAAQGTDFPSTGATSEWHVIAGTLQIRIDCGFCLSGAELAKPRMKDGSVVKDEHGNFVLDFDPIMLPDGSAAPEVMAFPMHTGKGEALTSTLTVNIFSVTPGSKDPVAGFHAELVTKTASPALWSEWSPDVDPLWSTRKDLVVQASHRPQPQLVQAVRLRPTGPMRVGGGIVELDATAAMQEPVDTDPALCKVPAVPKQADGLKPSYFAADPAPDGKDRRWPGFEALWNPPSGDARLGQREQLLKDIAAALEWDIRPSAQRPGNTPSLPSTMAASPAPAPSPPVPPRDEWVLESKLPSRTIKHMDYLFPALPWVCEGVGA